MRLHHPVFAQGSATDYLPATFLLVEINRRKLFEDGVWAPQSRHAPSIRPRRQSIVNRVSSFGKELLMRARYGSPETDESFP